MHFVRSENEGFIHLPPKFPVDVKWNPPKKSQLDLSTNYMNTILISSAVYT